MVRTAPRVGAILVAAGSGSRFGGFKQMALLGGSTVLGRSLAALQEARTVEEIVVVVPRFLARAQRAAWGRALLGSDPKKVSAIVSGGAHRVLSVREGVRRLGDGADVIVVHDAVRPLADAALVDRVAAAAHRHGAAIAAAAATDTIKRARKRGALPTVDETIPRRDVYLAQTPQAFRSPLLRDALAHVTAANAASVTDEASLIEKIGGRVAIVEAPSTNLKITEPRDLAIAALLCEGPRPASRIGHGFDLHRFVSGRPLLLGGVRIPAQFGLLGHSDGDVVLHALVDALLGAVGAPDIGTLFPDRDPALRGAASILFLEQAMARVSDAGYRVENADLVLHAERPRLSPHYGAIRESVARALAIEPGAVGLKAKTHEGLGAIGLGEAMAATALVLLCRA